MGSIVSQRRAILCRTHTPTAERRCAARRGAMARALRPNRYRLESLEHRTLLTAMTVVTDMFFTPPIPTGRGWEYEVASGFQTVAQTEISPGVGDDVNQYEADPPTGTIFIAWYGGGIAASIPVVSHVIGNQGYSTAADTPFTLNFADAGTYALDAVAGSVSDRAETTPHFAAR